MRYSENLVQRVWEKGKPEKGFNPDILRKDEFGAWIIRNRFGDASSEYSWEIDHVVPIAEGGSNDVTNLRPLQWENKSFKEADHFVGHVTSHFVHNLRVR